MNKSVITTNYFSIAPITRFLLDKGYKCYCFYHYGIRENDNAVSLSSEITPDKIRVDVNEHHRWLSSAKSIFTWGGKLIRDLFDCIEFGTISQWNLLRQATDFFEELCVRENVVAVILHEDVGAITSVLACVARKLGIPVFCLYNGYLSRNTMKYSPTVLFDNSSFYYVSGKNLFDWLDLVDRSVDKEKCVLTGFPHFDGYYSSAVKSVKREDNTFLFSTPSYLSYNSTLWRKKYYTTFANESWAPHVYLQDLALLFYGAFKRYLQYNPMAKLLVTSPPSFSESYLELNKEWVSESGLKNVEFIPFEYAFMDELLPKVSCFVGGLSTCFIEAIISRTPSIMVLGGEQLPDHFGVDNCYLKCCANKHNGDLIVEALKMMGDDKVVNNIIDSCNAQASYVNYDDDGNATKRVLDHLTETLGDL